MQKRGGGAAAAYDAPIKTWEVPDELRTASREMAQGDGGDHEGSTLDERRRAKVDD
jgi:hypothetical protein